MEIKNKNILIIGSGISGQAAFNALKAIANPFFYVENNAINPDLIVVSPGVAYHPAFDKYSCPIISELELGYLLNNSTVIAVTGTNGKTTVTRLIGEIFMQQLSTVICGNIGYAFSEAAGVTHKMAVVEASSFQLERCYKLHAHIAVITNITPDHLDRHKTMRNYTDAKLRIIRNQTEQDFLICPFELACEVSDAKSKVIFSDRDAFVKGDSVYYMNERVMSIADVKIKGTHNISNIIQAVCAAKAYGISNEVIQQAIVDFNPEPHRFEVISNTKNKCWIDDSKATNIGATLAACNSVTGSTALILGGSDKGYEYDELFMSLPSAITHVFVYGQVKRKLVDAFKRVNNMCVLTKCDGLADAVRGCSTLAVCNVLLSPAAASFDSYRDYKHRSAHFKELVDSIE